MILYACHYSRQMASARHRAYRWAERLERRGERVRVLYRQRVGYRPPGRARRLAFPAELLARGLAAEVIVFQKYAPPVRLQRMFRGRHLVFDFDDRIYTTAELRDRSSRFTSMLYAASRIIVSVDAIRDEIVGEHAALAGRIAIIPTLVDRPDYPEPDGRRRTGGVVIGWIGTSSGFPHLRPIEPALARLCAEEGARVTFMVVADRPYRPERPGLPVVNVPWTLEREHAFFAEFDVALMPLTDSPRARCKAGFKAIQSLAAGLPVVASPVGVNAEIVRDGETGFLARTPDEFHARLRRLADDAGLRRRMGAAARASAARYEYSAWEDRYLRQVLPAVAPTGAA